MHDRAPADVGVLPEWNLGDLYPAPESPRLTADLAAARAAADRFAARYEGRVVDLGGEALGQAIAEYEALQDLTGRLLSYAFLVYAGDVSDPKAGAFQQTVREQISDLSLKTIFFTLDINRIEDAALEARLEHAALARYRPWLRTVRAFRPHQLTDEAEKLLHEKQITGRGAWTRLFDETMAALRFQVRGESLTSAAALHLLSAPDGALRKEAAEEIGRVLGERVSTFALITNTLAKDKEIEDRWRRFARPISERNLANQVEDEVVDALLQAVRESFPRLSHRYYRLKAGWFGRERLDYWDRNAPLPEDQDRTIPWTEARDLVLGAYRSFSPAMAEIGARFFAERWIDAPVRPGKSPGAFAHPTVPSAHPYILMNYQGKVRDVMTLAHELGHGVHQVLAGPQGALMADTPLTLAETASVFGEQLTFQALLAAEGEPKRRRVMLATKVEDMINTVVRQVAFCEFERRVHDERRGGEVGAERIGEIWLAVQEESLGPSLRLAPAYRHYWSYIPHFVHTPFYVYAYAFGDCLVNSLYAVYRRAESGFAERYLDMLRAGGTRTHRELLAPFGLSAADPAFWSEGLGVIAGYIDRLEAEG